MTAPPAADRIRQMSAVTANFNGLRGLILVPAGLWLLVYGACFLLAPAAKDWALAAAVLPLAAMVVITRRYHARFGQVRDRQSVVHWGAGGIAIVLFMLSGIPVNLAEESPIWPQGLQVVLVMAV